MLNDKVLAIKNSKINDYCQLLSVVIAYIRLMLYFFRSSLMYEELHILIRLKVLELQSPKIK